jgi:photosystem II stability/assembly factor-like uncharacterized protein
MRLLGSARGAEGIALDELPGHTNHFVGNDSGMWQKSVRTFARVQYRNVYPGVDVIYYGNQRQLEYDFVIAPGASPSVISFTIEGAKDVVIDRGGDLIITSSAGQTIQRAPIAYQEIDGQRQPVAARFVLHRDRRISFRVGRYDKRAPLVIDPVLSYSTYLGGSQQERVNAVAVDAQGDVIVAGETFSSDFPSPTGGGVRTSGGDVFVARLNAGGDALRYVTYLGGASADLGTAVKTDTAGNAYVSGATFSHDFPTTDGFQPAHKGQSDGFVAKLDQDGRLVFSTLLGGTQEDYANGIAVDVAGRVYIAGHTLSADFPVVSPLQASLGGNPALTSSDGGETWSGMKTGLNTVGVRMFAIDPAQPTRIYAGTESEGVFRSNDAGSTWQRTNDLPAIPVRALSVADDGSGTVYVANDIGVFRNDDGGGAWTNVLWGSVASVVVERGSPSTVYAGVGSNSYPAGVLRSTDGGQTWAETGLAIGITAMAVSGSTVYAATANGVYRGGADSGWSPVSALYADVWTLAVDPVDPATAYVGTSSGLFKTTSGGEEWSTIWEFMDTPIASVAIAPSDPSTVYVVTWLGSAVTSDGGVSWRPISPADIAGGIVVHPHVPTTIYAGGTRGFDAFVATLSSDGSHLEYSTFFGGSSHEQVTDIAIDSQGGMYVAGTTHSRDLPVLNAVQPEPGDLMDVFAAKVAADGTLAYATYLAGWHSDYAARIDVDALGRAYVTGLTLSASFPVFDAFQPTHAGGFSDVFLSVLNPSGNGFVYSTFLGGSDMENDSTQSLGPDIAVTAEGEAYVTGSTMSWNFPITADAFQRGHRGGTTDAFVSKFDAEGRLQYSTFLGGAEADHARAITLTADGEVTVAGWTDSPNWPVLDGLQAYYGGLEDGFIVRIQELADSTPPNSSVSLSGTAGSGGWYRSVVEVALSAGDGHDGSGVRVIQYSVNGGPFESYTEPFMVDREGTTVVAVQAIDNAGNIETARTTFVRIDTTAPSLLITSPEARDYLHSDTGAVTVSASDDVSGMAGDPTRMLDGSPVYGSSVALLSLSLGAHTLTVAAVDAAGNQAQQSVTFRIIATVESLMATVQAYASDMTPSAHSRLLAKLADARAALQRGNLNLTANKLQEIVNYCTRESGDAMSHSVAKLLITDAQFVLGTLSDAPRDGLGATVRP